MPRPEQPEPLPPEVEALIDQALTITGGDRAGAIDLVWRKVNADDDFAVVRGAWMRWFRRNGGYRRARRRRTDLPR